MTQIIFVGLLTAGAVLFLKSYRPELASVVGVCGGVILLLFAVDYIRELLAVLYEVAAFGEIESSLVKLIIKIVGIGYLTEFSAQLVTDFGSPSIGDKIVLCGKIVIVCLAVPMVKSLLSMVSSFVSLLSFS